MEDYMSRYLEDFLNFIKVTEEQLETSKIILNESNIDLQDIQHYIEFGHPDAKGMWKVYKLCRDSRKRRRIAKENIELCEPIMEWYGSNVQAINTLKNLLGQVRKIERQQANRSYAIRGHILDDVTDMTHLSNRNGVK